jgi:hypothetical protein
MIQPAQAGFAEVARAFTRRAGRRAEALGYCDEGRLRGLAHISNLWQERFALCLPQ